MPLARDVPPPLLVTCCLVIACLAMGRPAAAQQPPTNEPAQTDVREWIQRKWKGDPPPSAAAPQPRRVSLFFAPIIASKPSTGVAFGVGASLEFPLGDLADTYVSSILPSASFSTKKQYSVAARLTMFGPRNHWAVTGDNHLREAGQEMYASDGDPATGMDVTFTSFKVMDAYLRRLPRGLYAGVGFLYQRQRDVAPLDSTVAWAESPYVKYSEQFGFDVNGQTSAGLAWVLRRDTRDNVSDPAHGWYAEAAYRTYFEGFLGGASTWQSVVLDTRGYFRPIAHRRHTVAAWLYIDAIAGGHAPYFALPATGTDPMGRSGRGYAEGRFRGDRLVYSELEYRLPLRADGLVGMVAFLNATAVGSSFDDEPLFNGAALGGGFGFRLRLDKRSRTNLCLDFGFGQHRSRGVYLALAEAF